jgi:hypothetical protein
VNRSIALFSFAAWATLVACASSNPAVDQPATTSTSVATAAAATTETAAPAYSGPSVVSGQLEGSKEVCDGIKGKFDSTLSAGSGKCKIDADCGCFGSSVSDSHMCGGVTDKETADKLKTIRREFRTEHCHSTSCKEAPCAPVCKAGVCSAS